MRFFRHRAKLIAASVLLVGGSFCGQLCAFDIVSHVHGDEETILVEKQPSETIPYSSIVKKISREIFSIDAEQLVTFGGNPHKCNIVRSFADLKDRTRYRLNVRPEEVEVKLLLEF